MYIIKINAHNEYKVYTSAGGSGKVKAIHIYNVKV